MSETRSFDAPPGDDFVYLAAFQQLVLERSHDLITVTDPLGTIVYASPSWHTVLGWDPEALLGTPALELVHPDDHGRADAAMRSRARRRRRSTGITVRFRSSAGTWIAIEASGSADPRRRGERRLSARHRPRRERARGAAQPRPGDRRALSHRGRDRAHDQAHRPLRRGRRDAARRDRCRPGRRSSSATRSRRCASSRGAALRRVPRGNGGPLAVDAGRRRSAAGARPGRRRRRASSPSSQAAIVREGIGALAFIPLVHDGRLLGKFMLYRDAPHEWLDRRGAPLRHDREPPRLRDRAHAGEDGPPRLA